MSTTQKAAMERLSVVEKFQMAQPQQFGELLDSTWRAITEIAKTIQNEVEVNHISPDDGRRAVALVSAGLLGYEQDRSGKFSSLQYSQSQSPS